MRKQTQQLADKVILDEVIRTEELSRRPNRKPDHEAENRALAALNEVMARVPETLLQKLVDSALWLCRAESAGVCILESDSGADVFLCHAAAGLLASHVGRRICRGASPCGVVIDRNESLLFSHPERYFTGMPVSSLPIVEILLVPFHVGERPVGAVWVATHSSAVCFDEEDQRVLRSLSRVASAGYQLVCSLRIANAEQATSEERSRQLRHFLDTAATGLVECDRDLRYVAANVAFAGMVGKPLDEIPGRSMLDVIGQEMLDRLMPDIQRVLSGEQSEREMDVLLPTGRWVTLHVVHRPKRNSMGHVTGWVASITDITLRKQSERELQLSREQLMADAESLLQLSAASTRLWRSPDLEEGLWTMLDATMTLLGADRGSVQLLDTKKGVLRIAAHRGFEEEFLSFFCEVSASDDSVCGRALRSGERIVIEDVETDLSYARYRGVARAAEYRSVQSTPLLARDGSPLGMLSTHWKVAHRPDEKALRRLDLFARLAADFIEHEKLSESLRDSRKRLQLFIEHAPVAIAMFDREMRYLAVSRRWISEYHLEGIDLRGRCHYDVFPDLPERWKEAHRKGLAGEIVGSDEDQYVHPDGAVHWVHWEVRPWHILDLEVGGIVVLVEDITARKEADMRLHDREARLKAVLDTATDAIISIDEQGLMTSINEAGFRMFGYTLSELQGQNINMLMPSPFCEEHDGYIRRYLATGERRIIGRSREAMALRRDGSTFPVELSVAEIDGERQFTGFIRDISERKELQRHVLEAAETEQQRIGSELHDGVQQELTALALFAGLMHRLVEGMSPSPDDREQAADQDRGQFPAALQQLTDITERLIRGLQETYQHVRDLAHGILPVVIDTEGLRAALEKLSSTMSASSGVPCSFVWSGDIAVHDNSVASHVYRIAQEAIGNAIHHGEPSRVELSLSGEKDHLVLEVADDGNGGGVLRSTASTGKGLRTMEYRASLIGGAIRIGRSRLGGTLVQCLIPRGVSAGESGSFQRDPDKPKTSGRAGYEAD